MAQDLIIHVFNFNTILMAVLKKKNCKTNKAKIYHYFQITLKQKFQFDFKNTHFSISENHLERKFWDSMKTTEDEACQWNLTCTFMYF